MILNSTKQELRPPPHLLCQHSFLLCRIICAILFAIVVELISSKVLAQRLASFNLVILDNSAIWAGIPLLGSSVATTVGVACSLRVH